MAKVEMAAGRSDVLSAIALQSLDELAELQEGQPFVIDARLTPEARRVG